MVELEVLKMPQVLPSCNSRRSNASNSPEFEFSSFPDQELHSADELFSGGVMLPLHHLHHHSTTPSFNAPPPPTEKETRQIESASINTTRIEFESESSRQDTSADINNLSTSGFTSSKRWASIFKKTDKKCSNSNNNSSIIKEKGKEKVRKKEKRNLVIGGSNGVATAELNINIWPFRRSRSSGNTGNRPRSAAIRKVSSAPCSRSNSAGESKSRKWPSSPSRGGVHVGRSSPIWQVRRPTTTTAVSGGGDGGRIFYGGEKCSKKDENQGGVNFPAAFSGGSVGGDGGRSSAGSGINAEKGIKNDENVSCLKFPAAVNGGSGGGDGGVRSFEGSLKSIIRGSRNNANESRRYFSSAVTSGSCGTGSGGGRSLDNAGKTIENGTKKDENESSKKFPATIGGGSGGVGGGRQQGKALNLNVPMCIGYKSRMGCRSDENTVSLASTATRGGVSGGVSSDDGDGDGDSGGGVTMEGVRGGSLFNIRSLFTKKVY